MPRPGLPTLAAVLLSAFVLASGCGPTYPNCNSDEDCNKEKDRHEFCVNAKCQQCRNDADCGKGKMCSAGRCDAIPDYCDDDSQCPKGSCIGNRCKPCASDDQCGEGGKCKQGKCLRKGACDTDTDCPEDQDCQGGKCVGGANKKPPQNEKCTLAPVYFDLDESNLSKEGLDLLDKNAACIKQVSRPVRVIGHTDPRGTDEYNLALSERRAQQVRDRLQILVGGAVKLQTLPKGELDATGRDESGWARDRRVDFEWM
jgi:peptidoglycan-associated lipoprotein